MSEPMQRLTLEEHKKIASFFRRFVEEGQEVYDLLLKRFPNSENPLSDFAKGVGYVKHVQYPCADACDSDRVYQGLDPTSPEWEQWRSCYEGIRGWCIIDDREED